MNTKIKMIALAVMLSCFIIQTGPYAFAHEHFNTDVSVSPWAEAEVHRAIALGLVPMSELPDDYQLPITRSQFRCIAMNFVALQENCEVSLFGELVAEYIAAKDTDGKVTAVFSDGDQDDSLAFYLGIIQGRGDGTFNPDSVISRQEAAVMLMRAYQACGGTAPEDAALVHFSDHASIADWASDSVSALAAWNVMNGMEHGAFMPDGPYTIEQCILTFLRLYDHAPVSRKNGNVVPMFSYEQCLRYIKSTTVDIEACVAGDTIITTEVTGPLASFFRLEVAGVMSSRSSLYFVYREGGMRTVDLGICSYPTPQNEIYGSLETDHCRFSGDGQDFYCDATLPQDVSVSRIGYGETLVHKAGVYHITVSVGTNQYKIYREDLLQD